MRKLIVLAALGAALCGCDQKALWEKLIPRDKADIAKGYIALLQKRDFEPIIAQAPPELNKAGLPEKLAKMADFFPNETALTVDTVGFNSMLGMGASEYNLTFQYHFPSKWVVANVAFKDTQSGRVITGFNVYPMTDSLEHINAFRFDGKTPLHFAFLAAAAAIPLFVLFTVYLCIRTPIPRRRWLWILFIVLPVCQVAMNWTDGSTHVNPISVQALGGGYFKGGPYAPVILWFAFPLGAILFLAKRRSYLDEAAAQPPVGTSPS